jgi:uncharacterized protein
MSVFNTIKKAFTGSKPADSDHPSSPAEPKSTRSAEEIYLAALEAQRAEKDSYLRRDPYSPITDRVNFTGLNYYPPDPAFRFTLPLNRSEPEPLTFQTSSGDERVYHRIGTVEFVVDGQPATLALYKSEDYDELFLPYRDATSGQETYGAGRYLEPVDLGNDQILVDFNLAYNPYCAYSPDFSCPLPRAENWLTTVAIRAGEKAYKTS